MYLLSAVCLTLLLYVIMKVLLRWYRQFCHYHTTAIAIELSNLSEIIHVHTAHVNIPITLRSVHDTDHHDYVVSGNWLHDFLKISKPIFLIHRDCTKPIYTPITFELDLFQCVKLRRIVKGHYLARIVFFQNDYIIPLSRIQVCNYSLPVAP